MVWYDWSDFITSDKKSFNVSIIFKVILVFFVSLFIINLFRVTNNFEDNLSFISFIDFLSKTNTINVSFHTISSIKNDWTIFNFLRDFFNGFVGFFNFIIFVGENLINIIAYVGQFFVLIFK